MLIVYGLTYDHTTNYGSCLQAYALQQAVEKIAVNGEKCSYSLIPTRKFMDIPADSFIIYIKRKLRNPLWNMQREKFVSFEKQNMKYVDCDQIKNLSLLNKKADAFVCGSDVIWHPEFNHRRGEFFLDFASKYKFSYAASFGKTEISQDYIDFVREKLATFDSISVREETSLQISKMCTDKDVMVVSDPVVLLDVDEWKRIMDRTTKHNNYIFAYTTHLSNTFTTFLQTLKKLTGLPVIVSVWNRSLKQVIKQGNLFVQTPKEWLTLLYGADYVVTNSFHATVFSTLFHKKFFTVVSGDKAKGRNMRMNDFLNAVGLKNRIYSSIPDMIDTTEIDYTHTDAVIARMRSESMAYLQRNLEEAYRQKTQQAKRRT